MYDTNALSLDVGRQMASLIGLSNRIEFVEQEVSLNWLRRVEPVDVVINLNLIRHAGALFDVEEVEARGRGLTPVIC